MSIREAFEAWWEINYHNGQPPRHGWEFWRDGEGYSIEGDEEFQWRWEAWQAATSAIEAKCAALAAKGMELAAEAAVVYGNYNETQMPDRDLVDMQTLQEMHDLCAGVKNADALLAEVRAQARNEGINYAASRLAAAFNHGFVDKPLTEVCDVVRMILDTKEDLANSTLPAADGLSGEYAEKFLEDFAVQLRQDANTAELVAAGIITKVGE